MNLYLPSDFVSFSKEVRQLWKLHGHAKHTSQGAKLRIAGRQGTAPQHNRVPLWVCTKEPIHQLSMALNLLYWATHGDASPGPSFLPEITCLPAWQSIRLPVTLLVCLCVCVFSCLPVCPSVVPKVTKVPCSLLLRLINSWESCAKAVLEERPRVYG